MNTKKPQPKEGRIKAHSRQRDFGSRHAFHAYFSKFAHAAARTAGSPSAFVLVVGLIAGWAVSGPLFGFSDTWQLVINTSTTIITFLMVFVIQNSQNRDSLAIQLKLGELIIAMHGAKNGVATIEELSDDDLEKLHKQMCERTEAMKDILKRRRS